MATRHAAQTFALATAPAAPVSRVLGIDVSHHQGRIDWPRMRKAGVRFALIKATEGTKFVDSRLVRNWTGALDAGIIPGAYHVVRLDGPTLQEQAAHYCGAVQDLPGGAMLPPALDVETRHIDAVAREGPADPALAVSRLLVWLQYVEARTHRRPLIYLSARGVRHLGGHHTPLIAYPLWLCEYRAASGAVAEPPPGWSGWDLWQWTSSASGRRYGVSSSKVDLDWWRGDLRGLRRWCRVEIRAL